MSKVSVYSRCLCILSKSAILVAHHSTIPFSSSQSCHNTTHFSIASRFHLTPLTMKIFTEPFFCLDNTIALEYCQLHTVQSQSHTQFRCLGTCRQLKFPSILVPCQEEATREPCLQPLRLLPIQLPMPMSLVQRWSQFSLQRWSQLNICWCGGEGVQGVLTLFCSGAAQVCHDDRVVENSSRWKRKTGTDRRKRWK